MSEDRKEVEILNLKLGKNVEAPTGYDPTVLDCFDNRRPDITYWVKFNSPELIAICPMTHLPDLANVVIQYVPDKKLVESKSLKLYLTSFHNHGIFHEDLVLTIATDLIKLMDPYYLEVYGRFMPRGGISIDPYYNYGKEGTRWVEVAQSRFDHHSESPEIVDNR